MIGVNDMQVVRTKIAVVAAVLMSVLAVDAFGSVKNVEKIEPVLPSLKTHAYKAKSPLRVMDKYFGIPRENIQDQYSFDGNNGDQHSYEVIFVYTSNVTHPGTNFFNEVYIKPDFLDSRKGEEAYRVTKIVFVKEPSGQHSVGYLANGIRRDGHGFVSGDVALIVPDDQTFAFNMLRTIANDPKAPFNVQCINSKRFFDNSNLMFLARADLRGKGLHFLNEKFNP